MINLGNKLAYRFNPRGITSQMFNQVDNQVMDMYIDQEQTDTNTLSDMNEVIDGIEQEVQVLSDLLQVLHVFKKKNKHQIDMFNKNQENMYRVVKPIDIGKPITSFTGNIKAFTCIPDVLMCNEELRENLFNCNRDNKIHRIEVDIWNTIGEQEREKEELRKSQGVRLTNYSSLQLFSQILL